MPLSANTISFYDTTPLFIPLKNDIVALCLFRYIDLYLKILYLCC